MAFNTDLAGEAVKHGGGTDTAQFHVPFKVFKQNVKFSDLGSGARDSIALAGFPTDAVVVDQRLEIVTPFAGEADLAVSGGDTADADGRFTAFNLNAVAAGWAGITAGAEAAAPSHEADWATAGADLTFTATELDDVTAGELNYYVYYWLPALSTE